QFRSMNWDIKYRNGCNTPAEVIEKSKILNKGIEGEHVVVGHMVYWRRKFPEFKRRYLQDYPRSRELFKYRMECESQSQQVISQNLIENTDPQIESSISHKRKYIEEKELLDFFSNNSDFSNISSDDSDYTRRKKKGKSVVDSVTKNLIAEKESADLEQARIQSNYVELNNKLQDPEEFLSESELYESGIELDVSEDKPKNTKKRKHIDNNISKNFEQKNKDNPEFKQLKRLFK
ncbi:4093_t:CDS:1, partial [Dentiscutata heterogama]